MRGATVLTLQRLQILRLLGKMTLMTDVRHIWNVIYIARSNRTHPPTSPNTAPATQNDSHEWCPSHMKRHLQCAEQQASPFNLAKYCACHQKWLASLILVTYETSFTMRGATGITLQPHQILCLPRQIAFQNLREILRKQLKRQFPMRDRFEHDPNMIRAWTRHLAPARSPRLPFALRRRILYWKLQHFALRLSTQISPNTAPVTKSDTPTSPNTAPATKNDSHDWYPWHMKRHLQCAEEQASPANLTKYCACHAKWLSCLIFVTYGTSFTMRGGTGITRQPHQILRLLRKMTLMIDIRDTWNVIYNARSNRHHPPTSPNTAPATQNDSHAWSSSHMERHLQCAEEQASPANLTKYCACHAKWLSWLIFVTYGTSFTMRGATGITLQPHQILCLPRKSALQNLSEILRERLKRQFQCAADSTMIRAWSDHELVISHPPVRRGYFSRFGDAFCIENYNISRSGYLLKFHRILRLPRKVTLRHHQILRLPRKVTLRHHQMLRLPRKVTLRHHQILRLPRKVRLLLNWAVTKPLLSCC